MSKETIKLNDNIQVLSNFQFSINIEYDLNDDTKIKNYIPTASAIDIIEDVMLSTSAKSADRARIFVGAYGKGKSHLALMLLALLCRKEKALYSDLLLMICETKPELCKYISDYQESNQKMLPVVIQGSSIGIKIAKDKESLKEAIVDAINYDEKILVEEVIKKEKLSKSFFYYTTSVKQRL